MASEDSHFGGGLPTSGESYWPNTVHTPRPRRRRSRSILWIHILLFLLTLLSASLVGSGFQASFDRNLPAIVLSRDLSYYESILSRPSLLLAGLPYSLTLLGILLAHEFGHYFACVYYRINATLPFFLPAPTFIGTLGAFIRIREPILSRKQLFDIGVAGPIAGFVFLVPALLIGVSLSKVIPGIAHQGDLVFGTPPLLRLVELVLFPGVPERDILLHPVARAGLVGLLATALNLLPVGQLDGGHIVYSFFPKMHRWISRGFILLLLPMGFLWEGWFFWAALLFIFGLKHPTVYDLSSPGASRRRVGVFALVMFLLCFTPTPVLG